VKVSAIENFAKAIIKLFYTIVFTIEDIKETIPGGCYGALPRGMSEHSANS